MSNKKETKQSTVVDKASKQKNNKKATKTVSVNVRLEIKPDGRIVWDVHEVHKLIAKQIVKDPAFASAKSLVKKDPSALNLAEFRDKHASKTTKEVVTSKEVVDEAAVSFTPEIVQKVLEGRENKAKAE